MYFGGENHIVLGFKHYQVMSKENDLKLAKGYFEEGKNLKEKAKYGEAIQLFEKASLLYETWEIWEKWGEVNIKIGGNYCELGKYDGGIEHLSHVLEISKKHLNYENILIAHILNNLGICHKVKGNYDQAIFCHEESLSIKRKILGKEHFGVTTSLNNLGTCHKAIGNYDIAIDYHQQTLHLLTELNEKQSSIAQSLNNLGTCYEAKGDYNLAINYYQKALSIREKVLDVNPLEIAESFNNLGVCYDIKGNYDFAISYHQKAIVIRKKNLGDKNHLVAGSLNNLGVCFHCYKGDYMRAISHFQEALSIWKKNLGKEHRNMAVGLNNLGMSYRVKGDYDLAISYYLQALAIWKKSLGENHHQVAKALNNLGACYALKGDNDLSILHNQQALSTWQKSFGKEYIENASSLNNLGVCFQNKKKYKLAISYYQEALLIRKRKFGDKHPETAKSLFFFGKVYNEIKNYDTALHYYQLALIALVPSFHQKNIIRNPTLNTYSRGYLLVETLNEKAQACYKSYIHKTSKDDYLQAALSTIHLATNLISQIRQSYKAEGSKHTLAEKAVETYNLAIQIALKTAEIYQTLPSIPQHSEFNNIPYTVQGAKELAFDFSEQSKSILLLSSLKDTEAKTAANIPEDLLKKEKQVKIELNYLDKSITTQEAKGNQKDEELLSKFQSQHFDYKQQYDELIEQFESDYPEYYRLKYAVETATVEEVQNYLNTQTSPLPPSKGEFSALISYHIAEDFIYIFTITPRFRGELSNDYQIQTVEKPTNFPQLIADFKDAIALGDIDEYMDSASILFDLLLLPILEGIPNTSKLIIIPHNELTTLSFDALIDTRKMKEEERAKISADCDFAALPYLVKDYDISYHYSATMLLHSVARQEQAAPKPASFVGFAPVSFDGSEDTQLALASSRGQTKVMRSNRAGEKALATLPNTANEVKEVFNLFEAQALEAEAFLYASANKENLFENAPKHKYVLIATHGYVQDENASLSGIYLARGQETGESRQVSGVRSEELGKRGQFNNSAIQQPNNYLLHTSEAYHLQLDADLVVLSSCSSGIGKLVTGEGMMAINRGFLYAGASNIIFTHFDIPDQSSGELVKRLFGYILEGGNYASALRKAKLEVIRQGLKTPEDWAGYALIGG